jgi:uncharacterized protein YdaU (DUF1376 family)
VNFYKHHIGDYDADTSHLTWLEDAAYRRLICLYYRREAPVPADMAQACRLVRATTRQERDAVEAVLNEFFQLSDDGWRHKRCEAEIQAASKKAEANRTNGKTGGRPRRAGTQSVSSIPADLNPPETQMVSVGDGSGNLSQTPDSRLQTSTYLSHQDDDPGVSFEGQKPTPAGLVCQALRRAGIANVNPGSPVLRALLDAGASEDEFIGAAPKALGKGDPFAYVLTVVRSAREEAARIAEGVLRGPMPGSQEAVPWHSGPATGIRAKGIELGLGDWDELQEQWPQYRARVLRAAGVEEHACS